MRARKRRSSPAGVMTIIGRTFVVLILIIMGVGATFIFKQMRAELGYAPEDVAWLEQVREIGASAAVEQLVTIGDRRIGSVTVVKVADPHFSDALLAQLNPLLKLRGTVDLDLSGTSVSDEGIRSLSLGFVTSLRLRGTRITPATIHVLRHIDPLLLDIRDTAIRVKDLYPLIGKRLAHILITDPEMDVADLASMVPMGTNLRSLRIEGASWTEADLRMWPELWGIELSGIQTLPAAAIDESASGDLPPAPDGPIADGPIGELIERYAQAVADRDVFGVKKAFTPPINTEYFDYDWGRFYLAEVISMDGWIDAEVARVQVDGKTRDGLGLQREFEIVAVGSEWKIKRTCRSRCEDPS